MPALAGKKALVKIPGAALTFTDEATTSAGDGKNYQITSTTKQVWDPTATITVKVGGVTTVEAYTANRLTGTVTFAVTDLGRGTVTFSGSYLPMSTALKAKDYSYQLTATNAVDSAFGDTYVSRVQTQKDVQGSVGRWWIDSYFSAALTADTQLVFQFFADSSTAADLVCWGRLSRRAINSVTTGLIEESLDFVGTLDADNRAVGFPVVVAAIDELTFLRSNYGDSRLKAIWLAGSGQTLTGSAVDALADARGGGFAPSLTATGTARPTYDAVNTLIVGDGTDDELTCSASSLFALDQIISVIVVGIFPAVSGPKYAAVISDATPSRMMGVNIIDLGGGSHLHMVLFPGPEFVDSTVASSTTRRLVICSKDATTGTSVQVPNQAAQPFTMASAPASGNNPFCLFTYAAASGNNAACSIAGVLVITGTLSAGDVTLAKTWATTYRSAVLA